jgi:hypothetical protein
MRAGAKKKKKKRRKKVKHNRVRIKCPGVERQGGARTAALVKKGLSRAVIRSLLAIRHLHCPRASLTPRPPPPIAKRSPTCLCASSPTATIRGPGGAAVLPF